MDLRGEVSERKTFYSYVEFKKINEQRKRQTEKQTVNCRKKTDGYQRAGEWRGMNETGERH